MRTRPMPPRMLCKHSQAGDRAMASPTEAVRWFDTVRLEDVPLVGGKNASLGELCRELGGAGVRVPNGFALTAKAYSDALTEADVWPSLHRLLDGLDVTDVATLADRAARARRLVYEATGTAWMRAATDTAYRRLEV